jgi:hypothetical protein
MEVDLTLPYYVNIQLFIYNTIDLSDSEHITIVLWIDNITTNKPNIIVDMDTGFIRDGSLYVLLEINEMPLCCLFNRHRNITK